MSTHLRVKISTKKAIHELKRVMAMAFQRDFTDDDVIRELVRSKVELKIDVKVPKEWITEIESLAKVKRE